MTEIKDYLAGIILTILLAATAKAVSNYIPMHLISGSVLALMLGMLLNPIIKEISIFNTVEEGAIQVKIKKKLRTPEFESDTFY